jgi:hypothetical protein
MEAPSNEGLSLRTAENANIEGLPIVDLEVTDDRIEGRVFSGTYESAIAEMKAFRPEFFALEVEEDESKDDTGLDKREGAPVSIFFLLCSLPVECGSRCLLNLPVLDQMQLGWAHRQLEPVHRRHSIPRQSRGQVVRRQAKLLRSRELLLQLRHVPLQQGMLPDATGLFGVGMRLTDLLLQQRKKAQKVRCRNIPDHINAIGEKCRNVFGQTNGRRDFRNYFIGLGKQKC